VFWPAYKYVTGIKIKWLVDELEKCPANEKLLVLDATHTVTSEQGQRQPSSAEMIATIVGTKSAPGLRTVTALASCSAGQRGAALPTKSHGGRAWFLAEGYGGKADRERAVHVATAEIRVRQNEPGWAHRPSCARHRRQPCSSPTTPCRASGRRQQLLRRIAADLTCPQVDATKARALCQVSVIVPEPEPKLLHSIMLWRAADPKDTAQVNAAKEFIDELKATLTAEPLPWKPAWQN
jgi:hypothetical protein